MIDSWAAALVAVSSALGVEAPLVPEACETELGALRASDKVTRARAAATVLTGVLREVERAESSWRW